MSERERRRVRRARGLTRVREPLTAVADGPGA